VQPAPDAAATIAVEADQNLTEERLWLRAALGDHHDGAGVVNRLLSEPGDPDAPADLLAAHIYLTSGAARSIDRAAREATAGRHVPFARCVVAGLRRLPPYRGVCLLRASLTDAELEWYRRTPVVTEWACLSALTTVRPNLPYETDVLLWSLSARRTAMLDPAVPDRVVFLPGTVLRVLRVSSGLLLLREIPPWNAPDLRDDVVLSVLKDAMAKVHMSAGAASLPADYRQDFGAPPGLITG
jgi:hypothetical protein